ncbi:alpha/beta hydrolase [Mycolicibacterium sp. 050158]|uniref:alpha/beta fold hydrolase n=1 Tax=Mycolicibacterium sp. 050158 TaxID=3090602 RepID=UPI00299D6428|nr:alpha/beta hydrolase [Mycolicibacterium sp. 050158]MDX1888869.1 alpha/beta hydrolase [Mycolicibacterium sp. 050158]
MSTTTPTVVLVHGAFADASGYAGVILELQAKGITSVAPPNPLRGLAFDADSVRAFVGAVDGPVVLVGHSYGGAVITQAAVGLDNVKALVYLAAFALDEGESAGSVQAPFAEPLLASNARPTGYPAGAGAAEGPDLFISAEGFRETFCADVPVDVATVLAATQRPVAAATLGEACTGAAWKTVPSWYLVSAHDNAINPDAQRAMAERIGATTETIGGSHTAFIAQPVAATAFILEAVDHVRGHDDV